MVETTNPNSSKTKPNVIHIGGIPVEFPYQPYGTQLAYMNRVISTLDKAKRDGHCHALLESPTGTGKSLSLLCSALAWQQNYKNKNLYSNLSHSKPNPEAKTDPLGHGGGFIPETQPSGNAEPVPSAAAEGKNQKKKSVPTIFYSSRTHGQITQVIREYRKTSYRVPMAILASRKHYCTNKRLHGHDDIDEQCKLLLKNQEQVGCMEFKNVHKVKGHPSLQKGGCHEVHDIEDLVKVGQVVKGCSYFAARSMADDAQLVFCPYNYIINPVIRRAMEIDVTGSVVILDEAHNIEDIARDAGSINVEEDVLLRLQTELEELSLANAMTYQPLLEMIQDILSWIDRRKSTLEKREFQHYFSCWSGEKALKELQEANISQQCFPILQECATKAIKAASDAEPEVAHLSGMAATVLEGICSALNFFFSRNGVHVSDFELALQQFVKREAGSAGGGWTNTFSLRCLNPAVVFREIADVSLSVILTSGTLSPMNSFSSELGVHFGTCLEAPHIIDVDSQLWTAVISKGPGNYPLNASYRTADAYAFQDELGKSLEEIFKIVPGGCLIFFPSYKLMEKLCSRWQETGQWSRLKAKKSLFVEPRGGSQENSFEPVLKSYYNSIRHGNKPVIGRKRRGKRSDLDTSNVAGSATTTNKGAAFLAVCRGKVSEGIDFSDEYARVVIIVGIPFPNVHDIQVAQKKKFNDTYKSSKNLLSGSEWYCLQAFRALNQATGRCIRHKFDYGAIIYLDERFCEERNRAFISKWFRKSIKQYDSFKRPVEGLKSFFQDVKDQVGTSTDSVRNSEINVEEIPCAENNQGVARKKNQKAKKSRQQEENLGSNGVSATENSNDLCQSSYSVMKCDSLTHTRFDIQVCTSINEKDGEGCKEYIDLDSDSDKESRLREYSQTEQSPDDPDLTIVKETPSTNCGNPLATPESLSKNQYISATVLPPSTELPEHLSCDPMSLINSSSDLKSTCLMVTPERDLAAKVNGTLPETELSINLSVNSHVHKRRKSLGLSSMNHLREEHLDSSLAKNPSCNSFMASSMTAICVNHIFESDNEINHSNKQIENLKLPSSLSVGDSDASCMPSRVVVDQRIQISCSLCRNPLGLPKDNSFVSCLFTSLSKVYLRSLWKATQRTPDSCASDVPVVISDMSSVDQRLCNTTNETVAGEGIWCREDGCVFNTIFCPFCSDSNTCLGVHVMATDASNIQLQDKILFYSDRLVIKSPETFDKEIDNYSPSGDSRMGDKACLSSIENFAYIPQEHNTGGWRTTKSKMRLPKRGLLSAKGN